jgi:hypothetical protein
MVFVLGAVSGCGGDDGAAGATGPAGPAGRDAYINGTCMAATVTIIPSHAIQSFDATFLVSAAAPLSVAMN